METTGQPWLVNRLGTILTIDIKPETTEPINEKDVEEAVVFSLTVKILKIIALSYCKKNLFSLKF